MKELVEEVLNRYIDNEKQRLSLVDEYDNGNNVVGSLEWKMREQIKEKISLLEDIRFDLLE